MFKDVQCEHHWSHDTHQADSPILAKHVPALHGYLFATAFVVPSAHPDLTPCDFSRSHTTRFLYVGIYDKIGLCVPYS